MIRNQTMHGTNIKPLSDVCIRIQYTRILYHLPCLQDVAYIRNLKTSQAMMTE
jgi:hypothetical protein